MSDYKEFTGKSLDEAIRNACEFYDVPREKLEVNIVSDAKAGVFGLVGARKAQVKARLMRLDRILDELEEVENPRARRKDEPRRGRRDSQAEEASTASPKSDRPERGSRGNRREDSEVSPVADRNAGTERRAEANAKGRDSSRNRGKTAPVAPEKSRTAPMAGDMDDFSEELPRTPLHELDQDKLLAVAVEVVSTMSRSIVGDAPCTASVQDDKVRVLVPAEDNSGQLIGKDGQTLSALQYLATRMVSNKMDALVRVQVDAGDYRERQDERLRDLAIDLAAKAKATRRAQLSRPLTSYQRRIIHLTLQDDPAIQTHSKGEGDLKRVVVAPRRKQEKSNGDKSPAMDAESSAE